MKGGGGDREGLSGISPSYRVIAVKCDMQMSHSEFVYSCQLAPSSSLNENNMSLSLLHVL